MTQLEIKNIKKNLKRARERGWWIACFYWERQLEKNNKEVRGCFDDLMGNPLKQLDNLVVEVKGFSK